MDNAQHGQWCWLCAVLKLCLLVPPGLVGTGNSAVAALEPVCRLPLTHEMHLGVLLQLGIQAARIPPHGS